jgi:hypothetical protein
MKITNVKIEKYTKILLEKTRPPSRGGNTNALHMHIITIKNIEFSFTAVGATQWVFKNDTLSFEYKHNGTHKNIIWDSIKCTDKNGNSVVRGNRANRDKIRTADARMPMSRREMRSSI